MSSKKPALITSVLPHSNSALQNLPSLLTSEEVCSLLRFSQKTLQRWRKARKLAHIRRNGRFLYPSGEIDRFITTRLVKAVAA